MNWIVGLDLTAGDRLTAACALTDDLSGIELSNLRSSDDLLGFVRDRDARVVAIDSPLGLPAGLCCLEPGCDCRPTGPGNGRSCERQLSAYGIPCYYTTKRSIIRRMVYRGMALRIELEREHRAVLEVYPYASKRRLLGSGSSLPRKSTPAGRQFYQSAVERIARRLFARPLSHDEVDAFLCAYTGLLWTRGQTEALGDAAEGLIHIPRAGNPAGAPDLASNQSGA